MIRMPSNMFDSSSTEAGLGRAYQNCVMIGN